MQKSLSTPRASFGRRRTGRALLEVVLAGTILILAGAASAALTRATLVLADDTVQRSTARALVSDVAERSAAAPCASAAGSESRPRLDVSWWTSGGTARSVTIEAALAAHPARGGASSTVQAVAGGWCP